MMGRIPEPYASMTNPLPDTAGVIARGRSVFEEGCASCHGREGLGNGEAGRELSLPPANLAMLTRMPMMRSDRYLFWAISEGGVPFGTQMPAFKDTLSADEIWSVVRCIASSLNWISNMSLMATCWTKSDVDGLTPRTAFTPIFSLTDWASVGPLTSSIAAITGKISSS